MAVTVGSFEAILSDGVGGNGGVTDPLPDNTEGLTDGLWSGLDLDVFPPPWTSNVPAGWDGTNILPIEPVYPIVPERKTNTLAFRTDQKIWKSVQKSLNKWSHEVNVLQYKLHRSAYMEDVYGFIKSHKGQLVQLSTPGIQPFMRLPELNDVYIKSITKPIRTTEKTYTFNILFLFDPNQL